MSRFLVAALVGLTIVATVSTSASAFHCVARSTNGASGWGNRIIFERAQAVALRSCAAAGGNAGGNMCRIVSCRY
jgi:hypothetical protein